MNAPSKNLSQAFLKARGDHVNMFWPMKYNQKCNVAASSNFLKKTAGTWLLLLFLLCLLLLLSACNMAVWLELWQPSWTMRLKTSWEWKEPGFLRTVMGKNHHTNLRLPPSGLLYSEELSSILYKLLLFCVSATHRQTKPYLKYPLLLLLFDILLETQAIQ